MPISQERMLKLINASEVFKSNLDSFEINIETLSDVINDLATFIEIYSLSENPIPKNKLISFLSSSKEKLVGIYQTCLGSIKSPSITSSKVILALEQEHFDKRQVINTRARDYMRNKRSGNEVEGK
jgi:hypothetical protein